MPDSPQPTNQQTAEQLASLAVNAANALRDEKRHYEIACQENARLRAVVARIEQMADAWEQRLPDVIRTPAVVSAIRAALEPAVSPSAVVSADRATLRERIAETLAAADGWKFGHGLLLADMSDSLTGLYRGLADKVLAVLPEQTDRAAVLLWAADLVDNPPTARAGNKTDAAFMAGRSEMAKKLRRVAAEEQPAETQASPAPLASGLPLVQGNCPACRRAGLFLGSGGYVTCSNSDCTEPDAATTVLEQYANEAHPPSHTWTVESPRRDNWASWGATYDDRDWAAERYEDAVRHYAARPYRLVRATTTYTVEAEHTPEA